MSRGRPCSVTTLRSTTEVRAEFAQGQFGVIAGLDAFADDGLRLRKKSGEQDAGLDLGAGHRQLVIDGAQVGIAVNLERRKLVVAGGDLRTHLGERLHDASHGPAGEGLVAADAAGQRAARPECRRACGWSSRNCRRRVRRRGRGVR